MEESTSVATKGIFSQRNSIWARYDVKKPRLPTKAELEENPARWVDDPNNRPSTFSLFIGVHNLELNSSLLKILEDFSDNKVLPNLTLLHGAKGSGKTSMAKILTSEIVEEMEFSDSQAAKWILFLDAKLFLKDLTVLWNTITKFSDRNIERVISVITFRVIVIDNIDMMTPTNQQGLRRLMEKFTENVRFFIISGNKKGVINAIQTTAHCLKSNQLKENDCLKVLLHFCKQHKIGYEREAIILLLKIFPKNSLTDIFDLMQIVFTKRYFISYENIVRIMKEKEMEEKEKEKLLKNVKVSKIVKKNEILQKSKDVPVNMCYQDVQEFSYLRILEPRKRCEICTLIPPCSHINENELIENSCEIRNKLLLNNKVNDCLEFVRYGTCTSFNKYNRCLYNHPKSIHKINIPAPRCTICTLLWPCNFCSYSIERNNLIKTIENVKTRLLLIQSLCLSSPSFSLVHHLDAISPNWKNTILQYNEIYCTPHTNQNIIDNLLWVNTSLCCDGKKFKTRDKLVLDKFQEILKSKLLDPRVKDGNGKKENNNNISNASNSSNINTNSNTSVVNNSVSNGNNSSMSNSNNNSPFNNNFSVDAPVSLLSAQSYDSFTSSP